MSAATCPHCRDQVTVPPGIDPEATVRCPLCQEEFQLSRVLESMPPQLIVVGGETSPWQGQLGSERPAFLAPAPADEESAGEEFRLLDDEETAVAAGDSEQFRFEEGTGEAAGGGKAGQRAAPARGRRSKPKKNPAMELVKIFVGGVAGLAIGYVLLWWILTAMGRRPQDPVGVAPAISRFVPWIVPASLRDPAASDGDNSGAGGFSDAAADSRWADQQDRPGPSVQPAPSRRENQRRRPPASRPPSAESGTGDSNAGALSGAAGTPADGPAGETPPPNLSETAGAAAAANDQDTLPDGVDVPQIDLPFSETGPGLPSADASAPPNTLPTASGELSASPPSGLLVADPIEVTASQFQSRLEDVQAREQSWETAERSARKQAAADWYVALGALGEAVTFADQADPEIRNGLEQAGEWLNELAAAPTKMDVLSPLGSRWLGSEYRRNRGVLLAGTVQSVVSEPGYFEIRLALETPQAGEEVSVLTRSDPRTLAKPDSRLLVLGAIADRAELQGYQGSAERLVLGGHLSRIP